MKRYRVLFLALFPAILLTACATPQSQTDRGTPALSPEQARIWIYRLVPKTSGNPPTVYVDRYLSCPATPYRTYYFDVAPGAHEITVAHQEEDKVAVTLEKGQLAFVRIDKKEMGFLSTRFYPTVVSNETGRAEIKQHKGIDVDSPQ